MLTGPVVSNQAADIQREARARTGGIDAHAARRAHDKRVVHRRSEIRGAIVSPHEGSGIHRLRLSPRRETVVALRQIVIAARCKGTEPRRHIAAAARYGRIVRAGKVRNPAADGGADAPRAIDIASAHRAVIGIGGIGAAARHNGTVPVRRVRIPAADSVIITAGDIAKAAADGGRLLGELRGRVVGSVDLILRPARNHAGVSVVDVLIAAENAAEQVPGLIFASAADDGAVLSGGIEEAAADRRRKPVVLARTGEAPPY